MRAQLKKLKANKSRACANSIGQKKNNLKQSYGVVDNHLAAVTHGALQKVVNNSRQVLRRIAFNDLANSKMQLMRKE